MGYEVDIQSAGMVGTVKYIEEGDVLESWWEYMSYGAAIKVPSSSEWDAYCEKNSAEWAKGRRQQILERVAQEACKQQAPTAKVVIGEEWIEFHF